MEKHYLSDFMDHIVSYYVAQAGLELMIPCLSLQSVGITNMYHHVCFIIYYKIPNALTKILDRHW
jgi:hypothetical protein